MAKNVAADALIEFLQQSPSPWHAVAAASQRLAQAGIGARSESEPWRLGPGEALQCLRRGSSVLAVRVPAGFDPARPLPFHVVVAHTDSPGLRLKPRPPEPAFGYRQWGVEVYGGALYNSWLDRDLGLAGRVCTVDAAAPSPRLVRLEDQPLRIPQLAIHLDRSVNEQGLILNAQKHLVPITGLADGTALEAALAAAAGTLFADLAFDLCLYDLSPARYGGLDDAFIYAGRLDNLAMCQAALAAFLAAPTDGQAVQVIALFDHEEVGSVSAQGAESNFLPAALERVARALGLDRPAWLALLSRSMLVSADMAHALHPNYADRHEPGHFPLMNRGVVLKANAGQRYATDGETAARFLGYARRAGVAVQNFLTRSDLGCGTTVGPGLSAQLGMAAVDIGAPMLSMHSAREMCGADDPAAVSAVLREFLRG